MLGADVRVGWPGGCQADTCKQQCTTMTFKNSGSGQKLRYLVTAYLKHPNWCGPYFKRPLPVAGLSKVRPTLLWSDLLRGHTELLTTCIQ